MDQCGRSVGRCVSPPSLFLSPPQPCFLINSSFPRRPQVLWITTKGDHPKKQNNTSRSRSTPHSPLSSLLRQTLETTDRAGCGCSLHVQERVLWNAIVVSSQTAVLFQGSRSHNNNSAFTACQNVTFCKQRYLVSLKTSPVSHSIVYPAHTMLTCVCVCVHHIDFGLHVKEKKEKKEKSTIPGRRITLTCQK